MIKPLYLGNSRFAVNIIQGPLAGISCAPFRRLTWLYGKPAFSCTEMISCKTLIYQSKSTQQRLVFKDPSEGPVCFQLAGSEPHEVAEATQRVTALGADLIDLNCGCPVKKIRSKGAGSSLLMDPQRLYHLIRAMKSNTSVPVSIKIRIPDNNDEKLNAAIAQAISDGGADFLVIHGRHWTQHYETPCQLEKIQFFVDALKIPVIGNGDISNVDSLKKMFATGCAGVMISRAGVGQPWLIQKLIAEMTQQTFNMPSNQEIGLMFKQHIFALANLLNSEKFAILQARKFAKYYARSLRNKTEFCAAINTCDNLHHLEAIYLRFFT